MHSEILVKGNKSAMICSMFSKVNGPPHPDWDSLQVIQHDKHPPFVDGNINQWCTPFWKMMFSTENLPLLRTGWEGQPLTQKSLEVGFLLVAGLGSAIVVPQHQERLPQIQPASPGPFPQKNHQNIPKSFEKKQK